MTSLRVIKAVSLLIVSAFMFAQFVAASHTHDDEHEAPEPSVCAVCITAAHSDGDLDIPAPKPVEPRLVTVADYAQLTRIALSTDFGFDPEKAPAPPEIGRSAPRAPPR